MNKKLFIAALGISTLLISLSGMQFVQIALADPFPIEPPSYYERIYINFPNKIIQGANVPLEFDFLSNCYYPLYYNISFWYILDGTGENYDEQLPTMQQVSHQIVEIRTIQKPLTYAYTQYSFYCSTILTELPNGEYNFTVYRGHSYYDYPHPQLKAMFKALITIYFRVDTSATEAPSIQSPTLTPSYSITPAPTTAPTITPAPALTPTAIVTPTPTLSSAPSPTTSSSPTTPTAIPTPAVPTSSASSNPSHIPSPSPSPTIEPTPEPTIASTPSEKPLPSTIPSLSPTTEPTLEPTMEPSLSPSPPAENNQTQNYTLPIALSVVALVAAAIGLTIYLKKRKRN